VTAPLPAIPYSGDEPLPEELLSRATRDREEALEAGVIVHDGAHPPNYNPNGVDNLIHYVMDLEALVRWFALPFSYEDQDGNFVQNEPIWTVHDEKGNYLPENDRLQRTWKRVMGDA
jgi:hypothetical protein